MTSPYRALCARMADELDHYRQLLMDDRREVHALATEARALLAQPEPEGLTDEKLLELMPQQFRDDLATVSRTAAHGAGPGITPGIFRVSLNTGALDYARAAIAADRARWCRPTPHTPADGEVGELVTLFAVGGHCGGGVKIAPEQCRRVSDLLQRFASPACYVISPSPEALAALEAAGPGRFEAMPAERTVLVPVAVSERPWDRDGWSDEEGQCWMGDPGGGEFIPSWRLCRPDDAPNMKVSLPANALPLPQGHDN